MGNRSSYPIRIPFFRNWTLILGKAGIVAEAQFSNYPFLLNNLIRSELFVKAKIQLSEDSVALVVIITKAHMFPASNSTLYYEQAHLQLAALASHNVFSVPIRLVGLYSQIQQNVPAVFTKYSNPRYSRTIISCREGICTIIAPKTARGRCTIRFVS